MYISQSQHSTQQTRYTHYWWRADNMFVCGHIQHIHTCKGIQTRWVDCLLKQNKSTPSRMCLIGVLGWYWTTAGMYVRTYVQYLCILAKIQSACQHFLSYPSHLITHHHMIRIDTGECYNMAAPVCTLTSRRKGTTCSLNTVTSLWYSFSVSIISWITLPLTRGLGVFLSPCSDVGGSGTTGEWTRRGTAWIRAFSTECGTEEGEAREDKSIYEWMYWIVPSAYQNVLAMLHCHIQ